jgi:hypothetical protein
MLEADALLLCEREGRDVRGGRLSLSQHWQRGGSKDIIVAKSLCVPSSPNSKRVRESYRSSCSSYIIVGLGGKNSHE